MPIKTSVKYTDSLVAIAAIDFPTTVKFYRQLLQQEPSTYVDNFYAEFKLEQLKLALFKPKRGQEAEFAHSKGSGISLCLEVKDLQEAIAYWQEIGYPPPGAIITASHGQEIYAYDPAGNRIILHQA
jgi:predicted enzyme related to lactoylglutathione lyase